jgi:hypothetical protein
MEQCEPWPYHPQRTEGEMSDGIMDGQRAYERVQERERKKRLAAAAAEMLEVLEEVAECSEYWSEYYVPLGLPDRIHAAIAKARGE